MTVRTRARFLPIGRDGVEVQPRSGRSGRAGARALSRHLLLCGRRIASGATSGAAQGELPKAIRVQVRDAATDRTLAVSTATLVHADMPADCVLAEVIADCLNRPAAPQPAG